MFRLEASSEAIVTCQLFSLRKSWLRVLGISVPDGVWMMHDNLHGTKRVPDRPSVMSSVSEITLTEVSVGMK